MIRPNNQLGGQISANLAKNQRHPPILIAISFQALNRALRGNRDTQECDCAVVIVFAGFYVEADLNDIIHRLGRERDMRKFLNRPHPGLQDKLAWFYNEYVARTKSTTRKELFEGGIERKLRRRFPGFAELYRFRNDIAHGIVNPAAKSLHKTQLLRQQAKAISRSLFEIAAVHGYKLKPSTDYYKAIGLK